jgi:hypothetical protein
MQLVQSFAHPFQPSSLPHEISPHREILTFYLPESQDSRWRIPVADSWAAPEGRPTGIVPLRRPGLPVSANIMRRYFVANWQAVRGLPREMA